MYLGSRIAFEYFGDRDCRVKHEEENSHQDDSDVERAPMMRREYSTIELEDRGFGKVEGDTVFDRAHIKPL